LVLYFNKKREKSLKMLTKSWFLPTANILYHFQVREGPPRKALQQLVVTSGAGLLLFR
jgi:hypothetical protein